MYFLLTSMQNLFQLWIYKYVTSTVVVVNIVLLCIFEFISYTCIFNVTNCFARVLNYQNCNNGVCY